jgi:hypothetical protein
MAKIRLAIIVGGKVDEIIDHAPGREVVRDCERMVDIGDRPDIVVGTAWPFSSWKDYQKSIASRKGGK